MPVASRNKGGVVNRRYIITAAVVVLLSVLFLLVYWCLRMGAPHGNAAGPFVPDQLGTIVSPSGIAVDNAGNLYVSARKQNRVLKVSPSWWRRIHAGAVTIAAGTGDLGFGGDGGPSENATLASPTGLAVDSAGNLFIADTGNNRIRRVDAETHAITTVAGNGVLGAGTGKIATASPLYEPVSVAVDKDENLYIGESASLGVLRVDGITKIVSKVIGAGLPGLPLVPEPAAGPFWVTMGESQGLFFSNPTQNTVFWFDSATNQIHPIAGGSACGYSVDRGWAIGPLLCFPEGLALKGDKQLFIADTGNNRIQRVDLDTGIIFTVAGAEKAGYSGDGGPAVSARLDGPMGIALDARGNLYIADTGNNCIRKLDAETGVISTWVTAWDLLSTVQSGRQK